LSSYPQAPQHYLFKPMPLSTLIDETISTTDMVKDDHNGPQHTDDFFQGHVERPDATGFSIEQKSNTGHEDTKDQNIITNKDSAEEREDEEKEEKEEEEEAEEEEEQEANAEEHLQKEVTQASNHRQGLRAKILHEIGRGTLEERMKRAHGLVESATTVIVAAEHSMEDAARHVATVERELKHASQEVQEAIVHERCAASRVREEEDQVRLCQRVVALKKSVLQEQRAMLVLLEMEASAHVERQQLCRQVEEEQSAKRRKIEELEKVVAESQKAVEMEREREREARNAMKKLLAESKQLTRLGPFAKRQQASHNSKLLALLPGKTIAPAVKTEKTHMYGNASNLVQLSSEPVTIDDDNDDDNTMPSGGQVIKKEPCSKPAVPQLSGAVFVIEDSQDPE